MAVPAFFVSFCGVCHVLMQSHKLRVCGGYVASLTAFPAKSSVPLSQAMGCEACHAGCTCSEPPSDSDDDDQRGGQGDGEMDIWQRSGDDAGRDAGQPGNDGPTAHAGAAAAMKALS